MVRNPGHDDWYRAELARMRADGPRLAPNARLLIALGVIAALAIGGAAGMLVSEMARMDRQFAMEARI